MASLKNEQVNLEAQLAKAGADPAEKEITFEQVMEVFLEANRMASEFIAAPDDQKRRCAEIVLSNIRVKDNSVQDYQLKTPYESIARLPKNPTIAQLRRGRDSNPRCHFWHTVFPGPAFQPLTHLSLISA